MKSKKGQAAVEFALVIPILLLLVCGIFDFGRILYAANTVNFLSQEAARYVSLESTATHTDAEVAAFVKSEAILENKDSLVVDVAPDTRKPGVYATVTITYNITYITPFMNSILPSPYSITSTSTIRVE